MHTSEPPVRRQRRRRSFEGASGSLEAGEKTWIRLQHRRAERRNIDRCNGSDDSAQHDYHRDDGQQQQQCRQQRLQHRPQDDRRLQQRWLWPGDDGRRRGKCRFRVLTAIVIDGLRPAAGRPRSTVSSPPPIVSDR